MPKPIKVDLPYIDFSDLKQDEVSAKIISSAYASLHSELSAVLQYIYHAIHFENLGDKETAGVIEGIAITEMMHFKILGALLLKLGVRPIFSTNPPYLYNFFNTSKISYSETPQKMLLDDITGEMLASREYEEMIKRLKNEKVSAVITRIRLDEELHIKVLKEILERLEKKDEKSNLEDKITFDDLLKAFNVLKNKIWN